MKIVTKLLKSTGDVALFIDFLGLTSEALRKKDFFVDVDQLILQNIHSSCSEYCKTNLMLVKN